MFNNSATCEISSLSLHDALPISDLLDPCGQLLHKVVDRPVGPDHVLDLRVCVQDGGVVAVAEVLADLRDRKSTRLNSSHMSISYAVFCLKKKTGDCA